MPINNPAYYSQRILSNSLKNIYFFQKIFKIPIVRFNCATMQCTEINKFTINTFINSNKSFHIYITWTIYFCNTLANVSILKISMIRK